MKKKTLLLSGAGAFVALGLGAAIVTNPNVAIVRAEDEVVEIEEPVVEETTDETGDIQKAVDEIVAKLSSWDIKTIFTPQNILSFLSVLMSSGFGVALVKVYAKYKGEITITRKAISDSLEKLLPEVSSRVLNELVTKVLEPMVASIGSMEEAIGAFSRCLALAQENTPESRLAILKELEAIKIKDESVIARIDAAIRKAVEETQKQIDEKLKLLDDMMALQKEAENNGKKAEEITEEKSENGTDI